jgi:hypothetical protein
MLANLISLKGRPDAYIGIQSVDVLEGVIMQGISSPDDRARADPPAAAVLYHAKP